MYVLKLCVASQGLQVFVFGLKNLFSMGKTVKAKIVFAAKSSFLLAPVGSHSQNYFSN